MAPTRVVYWFRTDLRLHDSPALKAALDLKPEAFWPVWTWDPHYVYRARVGVNRFQFLIDCQNDLSKSITKLNKKSKLFLIREAPQTLFPKLFKAWKVTHLVFEKDTDAYGRERDEHVMKLAKEAGVQVIVKTGRTLWDSDELVAKNGGKPTMSISEVEKAGPKVGAIPRPIPAPKSLPDPGDTPLDFEQEQPDDDPDFNKEWRTSKDKSYYKLAGPNGDFAPPTLEEMGMPKATSPHKGGEKEALKQLEQIVKDKKYTATFEKPKTSPAAFEPQATTLLSPHLHFGSLGIREFYWRVKDVVDSYKGTPSHPPMSLEGQLLFRDMYFGAMAKIGYPFGQTFKNDHCRFIPWHLQSTTDKDGRSTGGYEKDSEKAEEWLQRWKWGKTGFPWIDALMRQLRQEGWIHHLGRHSVACFLTRGGCWISWERGCEVFEEWLLDHEAACNAGNWQWLSCTAFFAQYYRCYSPVSFPQKWDKDGAFVRRYVPELKDLDKKFIYEPWKADAGALKAAKVTLADDWQEDKKGTYPAPMFDFAERRDICIAGMKAAYHVGLHGNDKQVLDGSWRKLFQESDMDRGGPDGVSSGTAHGSGKQAEETDEEEKQSSKSPKKSSAKGRRKRKADDDQQKTLDAHVKKTKA